MLVQRGWAEQTAGYFFGASMVCVLSPLSSRNAATPGDGPVPAAGVGEGAVDESPP
ncbi:hypothetical protein ACWGH8_00590 [Nonomuraea muscovyensis]